MSAGVLKTALAVARLEGGAAALRTVAKQLEEREVYSTTTVAYLYESADLLEASIAEVR